MPQLTLGLLGHFQAALDGQPVTGLAYAKVRALLAYLAAEPRPHSRDALADLLWPGQPAASARRSLRVALATLRQALGDPAAQVPFLLAARDSIQLNRASQIRLDLNSFVELLRDAHQHTHSDGALCSACAAWLAEATALYRGDFLQQLEVRDSMAFEEWVTPRREQLHRDTLEALAALAAYHEAQGHDSLARQYAWRTLALEPWDEAAHRCVMRVLARKGQRSAALAQYARCRTVLADELGAEPAGETTALFEQIRSGALARAMGSMPQATRSAPQAEQTPTAKQASAPIGPALPLPASLPTPLAPPSRPEHEAAGPSPSCNNLPAQLTAFVGREVELAQIAQLLADPACRLLTIAGAGGSGKTRLALQAAGAQSSAYTHGVYLVPLASISSAEFLVSAIAGSLGFTFSGSLDLQDQLLGYLREKHLLLVLDNFEHLLNGQRLVADILSSSPEVKLLVTSRERLNLYGEWVCELKGLAVPQAHALAQIEEYSAAQLFLGSARRARVGFSLSEAEKPAVIQLCRMLEGLPLGLELAASWVRVLSCKDIAQELLRSLDLLTTSSRHVPERHRSMRAVFEHSWNLLSAQERDAFRRLSVFQGGFERAAAEHVAGASLPVLAGLVDKSLLWRRPDGRYEMHELLRQYATERLMELLGAQETAHDKHSRHYLTFLRQQEQRLKNSQQQQAMAEIRSEIDNIRLALQRAIAQQWAKEVGQAAQALLVFYDIQGWLHEAEAIFRQAAGSFTDQATTVLPAASEARPKQLHAEGLERERSIGFGQVLAYQGWFSLRLGLIGKAKECFEHSVALLRRLDARSELGATLQFFSMVAWAGGDYPAAQAILQEGLTIYREQQSSWSIALCVGVMGNVAAALGNYAEAKHLLQQALALFKELGDPRSTALALSYLGPVAYSLGDYDEAKQWLQESLTLNREIADRWSMILCLNHLGAIAFLAGAASWPEAKRLHEESLAIAKELGDRREIAVSLSYLGHVTCALEQYPEAQQHLQAALQIATEGQMTPIALDVVVGIAMIMSHQPTAASAPSLTQTKERAVEILALVLIHSASGREAQDRARRLLAELAAELPHQAVADAQERGQARRLEEIVAEILAEKM